MDLEDDFFKEIDERTECFFEGGFEVVRRVGWTDLRKCKSALYDELRSE